MAKVDLFVAIKSLWTKERLEGMPPTFIMHRFLASDRDLAPVAKDLQKSIKGSEGDAMRIQVWRGILPKGRDSPRLSYVAPKKRPSEDKLTTKMMEVLSARREVVEEMIELFKIGTGTGLLRVDGSLSDLYHYFGVDEEEAEE